MPTALKKRKTSTAPQTPLETYLREINETALLTAVEEKELAVKIGNGDTAGLHNAAYDFNDDALPYGISYWVSMAETALAA